MAMRFRPYRHRRDRVRWWLRYIVRWLLWQLDKGNPDLPPWERAKRP